MSRTVDAQTIALALPWHAVGLGPFLPGNDLRPCVDCSTTLVVGPATAAALTAEPTIALCCPACALVRCRQAPIVGVAHLSLVPREA